MGVASSSSSRRIGSAGSSGRNGALSSRGQGVVEGAVGVLVVVGGWAH